MFLNWFACVAFQLKRAIGFYGKVFPKHRILQLLHCNMYDYGLDAFISFIPCCYICAYLSEKETKFFQAFEVNQRKKGQQQRGCGVCTKRSCRNEKGRPWIMSREYCRKLQGRNHVVFLWAISTHLTVHLSA